MPITRSLTRPLTQALTRELTDAGGGGGGGPSLVSVPSGFGMTPLVNVFRSSGGVYTTDYDPGPILVEGDPGVITYYVDSATGNEAWPGTQAQPKASLRTISSTRQSKLLIKARGTFYGGITGSVFAYSDIQQVEAWGGAACLITMETNASFPMVWTDETGGVWSSPSPHAGMNSIMAYSGTDVDTMVNYPIAANLAACQATPGTIFTATGPIKHYVHTLTGASPATGHRILGANGNAAQFGIRGYDQRVQYRGIDFLGGDAAFSVGGADASSRRVDFIGCSFKHARTNAALACTGDTRVFTYQCIAGPTRFDGFAYTAVSGFGNYAVEIGNIGRNCGYITGANQGSTAHLACKVQRINCQYYGNSNQQIADVNAGTVSWNLGCAFGPERFAGSDGVNSGNDGGDTKIWLDGCTFTGMTYEVVAFSNASVFYKNMAAPTINPLTVGTVTTY